MSRAPSSRCSANQSQPSWSAAERLARPFAVEPGRPVTGDRRGRRGSSVPVDGVERLAVVVGGLARASDLTLKPASPCSTGGPVGARASSVVGEAVAAGRRGASAAERVAGRGGAGHRSSRRSRRGRARASTPAWPMPPRAKVSAKRWASARGQRRRGPSRSGCSPSPARSARAPWPSGTASTARRSRRPSAPVEVRGQVPPLDAEVGVRAVVARKGEVGGRGDLRRSPRRRRRGRRSPARAAAPGRSRSKTQRLSVHC